LNNQVHPDNIAMKHKLTLIDTTYNYILYHCSQVYPDNITMKYKYISTQSNELLSYFNDKGKVCFDSKTALKAFPDAKESTVRELLSDMTKRGLLMRIKDGAYYIIPYLKLYQKYKKVANI